MNLAQFRVNTPIDGFPLPSPRLFGNNPSCEVIAQSSYILSNRVHSCNYWSSQEARWFLTWCGSCVDPALLWAYFSMKTPTVRAVYENLLTAAGEFKEVPLFTALYNLRHAVVDEPATRCCYLFRTAVSIGSHASPKMLQIAQDTCPRSASARQIINAIPGQLDVSWVISKAAIQADLPMMQLCISIGARMDEKGTKRALGLVVKNLLDPESMEDGAMGEYARLLLEAGFFLKDQPRWPDSDTGLHLRLWHIKRLTLDRLIYECPPEERKRLYKLFSSLLRESEVHVSLAGVLTFAQDGPDALNAYLQSHVHHGDRWDAQILERCLSEAASLGEISICSSLLGAGVDPNAPSLPQEQHQRHRASLWAPVARTAMAGYPELLRLFLADERLDVCSLLRLITSPARVRTLARVTRGIFTPESVYFNHHDQESPGFVQHHAEDASRSEAIDIVRAVAKSRNVDVDANILHATLGFSTEEYGVRDCCQGISAFLKRFCQFRLDRCQALLISGLVENNLEFELHGMDLLHLSIQNGCSLDVAEFLLGKGFEIHSRPCSMTGYTMLHSALLSQSADRSDMVDLLLRKGAEYMIDGGGMSILEASLADNASTLSSPQEYLAVFKKLFRLGAPISFPQQHRVGPERRCLINLLLEANAEDDLVLELVDAGADVNDRGGGTQSHTTPLQQAIERGRQTLAVELIRRGANVCAPAGEDCYGFHYTALQKACATKAPMPFIHRLVEAGADVNEPPPARGPGLTSLEFAARLGALNLAQYLLEQGARVNDLGSARGCDPFTSNPEGIPRTRPLDWAACDGRLDMVSFLLESGGRSGRPGTTGLDGAIDAATVHTNHFAVAGVLQAWAAKHAGTLLQAEAAWQRTNSDASSGLLELWSQDDASESGNSTSSYDSDDSGGTDEPLD